MYAECIEGTQRTSTSQVSACELRVLPRGRGLPVGVAGWLAGLEYSCCRKVGTAQLVLTRDGTMWAFCLLLIKVLNCVVQSSF
jgi:hypothetical protein